MLSVVMLAAVKAVELASCGVLFDGRESSIVQVQSRVLVKRSKL